MPCCLQRREKNSIAPTGGRGDVLQESYIRRKSVPRRLEFERGNFSHRFQPARMRKESTTDREQLFIKAHFHKVTAAVRAAFRTTGPAAFVSAWLKSQRKTPAVPAQRENHCFPICCPVQTWPYQSRPGHLLFHILLMYWKAFHSWLPLSAGPEQVSIPDSTMENNQAFLLDTDWGGWKPLWLILGW